MHREQSARLVLALARVAACFDVGGCFVRESAVGSASRNNAPEQWLDGMAPCASDGAASAVAEPPAAIQFQ